MSEDDADPIGHQERVARLAADIAARLGAEPQSELTAHLARIAARQTSDPGPSLEVARQALQESPGVPEEAGASKARRALADAVAQLADEVAAQRRAIDALLDALADSFRPATHHHPDLEGELDALHDRFAMAERNRAWTPSDLEVVRRLDALEADQRADDFQPFFSSTRFTDAFRGSQEALEERYQDLADAIAAAATTSGGPVLDLGCGGGDMLALLAARDVDARGVDSDAESVDRARSRGLHVERGDAVEALRAAADGSLGAVVLVQVVEHLGAQTLVDVVALAAAKLAPGGLLVAETVNPGSLYVYGHALYLDPTHTTPIHPAYLRFVCEEAGFSSVDVQMRSHPPVDEALPPVRGADDALVADVNQVIERLNSILFGPQDYAVLATR